MGKDVITVTLIHYRPGTLSYPSSFISASCFYLSSAISVLRPPALINIHTTPCNFSFPLAFPSVPLLHLSFKGFPHPSLKSTFIRVSFPLHLWPLLYRSLSFPPFPVCMSPPSLLFQIRPGLSLHLLHFLRRLL